MSASRKQVVFATIAVALLFLGLVTVLKYALPVVSSLLVRTVYREFVALPDYEDFFEADVDPRREGGHLAPNLNTLSEGERLNRPVRFITNSKGFRNAREFDYRKPEGTFRVLLMGDSFIDGMRTDQERTIGHLMEQILKRALSKDVEVMISGQNNPANAWYNYQEHGWKYHPDLVILGITLGNDLSAHNYRAALVPTRVDGQPRLALTRPRLPLAELRHENLLLPPDAYTPESRREALDDLEIRLRRGLASRLFVFSQSVPPFLDRRHNARRQVRASEHYVTLGLFYRPTLPAIEELYVDLEDVLAGMNDHVRSNRSAFLAVILPVRIQVHAKDWRLLIRAYSLNAERFDLEFPDERILETCRTQRIACLDLLPEFRKAQQTLYRPLGDMHFNEAGQEIAAKIIANHVLGSLR